MKQFFTLLTLFCSLSAMAQVKVSGTIQDSTTSKAVEFATVALMDKSGKAVDGTVCDDKGEFSIGRVQPGSYQLTITFIGFDKKVIALKVEDKNVNVGTISISPTAQVLKEVTVEGERSLIEERVDRTIYNAENDQTAKGGDASDVLRRVPLLSVDMDGNVSLRGNSNITVLINNKPSTIVASSVADALRQIPADEIKTVEVITSPSAKYDAEGSAGIINIVTKKNTLQGLTLNVDAGVGYRGSNLGLNGNYRRGKMGFSLGGWGRANYNIDGAFENEQKSLNQNDGSVLSINQQSASTRQDGMFGRYNLGWDYDIDKKNVLAASVRFGLRNNNSYQDNLTNRQLSATGSLLGSSLRNTESLTDANSVDASLTYTRLYDTPQRELSFQALYSRDNNNNDFSNTIYAADESTVASRIKNLNDANNQEVTFQIDYQTPIGKNQMLEIGGKDILRKAVSDFSYFRATGATGEFVVDNNPSLNNNLNYDQNVMAGYLSYTISTKSGYSIKAGSRYEHTTIEAFSRTDSNIEIPAYGVIVPSVNVSKKLKGGSTLKGSYNRRIQRPSIRFLNPNIQAANPLNVTIGNPTLDPEFTNNYELSYSSFIKGFSFNVSGFVRNTNDGIQSVRDVLANNSLDPDTIRTTFQNIGSENAYGSSVFANIMLGKLTLNGGGDLFYAVQDNNNPDPRYRAQNEGWVINGRIFGSYNLDKGWGLQFFSFARGRQVQLQGTQGGFYMYSLAVRKEFNEKRGSIGLGFENFLQKSIRIKSNLESPVLIQESLNTQNNFSFRLNFSYRIGKMSMEAPRRRRSINNDDLKDGGEGGGGDMQMGGSGGNGGGGGAPSMGGGGRPQGGGMPSGAGARPATPVVTPPANGEVYASTGTWAMSLESPQGVSTGTIVLKKDDAGNYTGTIKTERMPQETAFTSVVVKGNEVTMNYTMSFGGNTVPVEIKTVLTSASDMQGTMSFGQFRTMNMSAKKAN